MLDNIPYSTYPLGGLTTLAENLTKKATTHHPDDPMITASVNKVASAIELGREAIGSGMGSLKTKSLAEADNMRDLCYRSLRDYVKSGLMRESNKPYQKAAEKVWQVFKNNNTQLAKLPYREESAAIKSLLADIEAVRDEVAVLNGTEWVEELKSANLAFEAVLEDRTDESATTDVTTDRAAAVELTNALKVFVSTIDSLSAFGQPSGIEDTVVELNQIIKEANTAAK
ncbi:DUF6261 family protein [Reichenbachiella versicolor]|uniref:DUF6261 family protein n=1 Tax=Reichenbachiella versicolor TaxID=1821036 RepID=UPI000D6DFAF4|nr:DUF6261 family protein [Reichenbachiella versicolor]